MTSRSAEARRRSACPHTDARHDTEARQLLAMRAEAERISSENAALAREHDFTSADAQRWMDAADALHAACEEFRRRYYPRAGRVIAAGGYVIAVSPKGQRTRTVFEVRR